VPGGWSSLEHGLGLSTGGEAVGRKNDILPWLSGHVWNRIEGVCPLMRKLCWILHVGKTRGGLNGSLWGGGGGSLGKNSSRKKEGDMMGLRKSLYHHRMIAGGQGKWRKQEKRDFILGESELRE